MVCVCLQCVEFFVCLCLFWPLMQLVDIEGACEVCVCITEQYSMKMFVIFLSGKTSLASSQCTLLPVHERSEMPPLRSVCEAVGVCLYTDCVFGVKDFQACLLRLRLQLQRWRSSQTTTAEA